MCSMCGCILAVHASSILEVVVPTHLYFGSRKSKQREVEVTTRHVLLRILLPLFLFFLAALLGGSNLGTGRGVGSAIDVRLMCI